MLSKHVILWSTRITMSQQSQLHSSPFHTIFTAVNKKVLLFSAFLTLAEWLNTSQQMFPIQVQNPAAQF